jgi:hypothetical protein
MFLFEENENAIEFICDVNSAEPGLEKYFKPFQLKKQKTRDVISLLQFINT